MAVSPGCVDGLIGEIGDIIETPGLTSTSPFRLGW